MAQFTFRFYFQELDETRRYCEVSTWGGHLGTAFNRAWKSLRENPKYRIPNLRPTSVDIAPPAAKQRKGGNKWMGTGAYTTTVKAG